MNADEVQATYQELSPEEGAGDSSSIILPDPEAMDPDMDPGFDPENYSIVTQAFNNVLRHYHGTPRLLRLMLMQQDDEGTRQADPDRVEAMLLHIVRRRNETSTQYMFDAHRMLGDTHEFIIEIIPK